MLEWYISHILIWFDSRSVFNLAAFVSVRIVSIWSCVSVLFVCNLTAFQAIVMPKNLIYLGIGIVDIKCACIRAVTRRNADGQEQYIRTP